MRSVLDLLKPGSCRDGDVLITSSVLNPPSVDDFEQFDRENKK